MATEAPKSPAPAFPELDDAERVRIAATLTAAACALVGPKERMPEWQALEVSQRIFQGQLTFLEKKTWPKALGAGLNSFPVL